jgi:hypothetical protein
MTKLIKEEWESKKVSDDVIINGIRIREDYESK